MKTILLFVSLVFCGASFAQTSEESLRQEKSQVTIKSKSSAAEVKAEKTLEEQLEQAHQNPNFKKAGKAKVEPATPVKAEPAVAEDHSNFDVNQFMNEKMTQTTNLPADFPVFTQNQSPESKRNSLLSWLRDNPSYLKPEYR